jgi:hypothetical protein
MFGTSTRKGGDVRSRWRLCNNSLHNMASPNPPSEVQLGNSHRALDERHAELIARAGKGEVVVSSRCLVVQASVVSRFGAIHERTRVEVADTGHDASPVGDEPRLVGFAANLQPRETSITS